MGCGYCQLGGICHQVECARWPETVFACCSGSGKCEVCDSADPLGLPRESEFPLPVFPHLGPGNVAMEDVMPDEADRERGQ